MTLEQLRERVREEWCGYGTHRVYITYRGKEYTCLTHNTLATDRLRHRYERDSRSVEGGGTEKQAYEALWDECKRKNVLGEWKNFL
jgi:hypothetical protein